jgi:hypothetical protein
MKIEWEETKLLKKSLALTLCLATVLSSAAVLSSCASNQSSSSTTTSSGTSTSGSSRIWLDDLSDDLYFDGETVTIVGYYQAGQDNSWNACDFIGADEADAAADSVNAAKFQSVKTVENRLGVTLEFIDADDWTLATSSVMNSLAAGDSEYDILVGYQHRDVTLASNGYLLSLDELEDQGINYIDINKSYWGLDYINQMSYKNHYYLLTGDISTAFYGFMFCTYVNKNIYEKYLEGTYGNIYELVSKGQWTLDLMAEMSALCYQDTNGNDKADEGDQFGFAVSPGGSTSMDGLGFGAGFTWTQRYDDGEISFNVGTSKNEDIYSKLWTLINNKSTYTDSTNSVIMNQFLNGEAAFTFYQVSTATYFADMTDEYGIIPVPKYSVSESSYRTLLTDALTVFGISYFSEHAAASAAVLEALCAEHSRTVKTEYYDKTLKYGYTRDDDSAKMIDLIYEGASTDFGYVWGYYMNDIYSLCRTPSKSLARIVKSNESAWSVKLENLLEDFDEMEASRTDT